MWTYAAVVLGTILVALAIRRHFSRRKGSRPIDKGVLSDAWLAEQRSGRNRDQS